MEYRERKGKMRGEEVGEGEDEGKRGKVRGNSALIEVHKSRRLCYLQT